MNDFSEQIVEFEGQKYQVRENNDSRSFDLVPITYDMYGNDNCYTTDATWRKRDYDEDDLDSMARKMESYSRIMEELHSKLDNERCRVAHYQSQIAELQAAQSQKIVMLKALFEWFSYSEQVIELLQLAFTDSEAFNDAAEIMDGEDFADLRNQILSVLKEKKKDQLLASVTLDRYVDKTLPPPDIKVRQYEDNMTYYNAKSNNSYYKYNK